MNLKRLLLMGIILLSGILNAQKDFRPGYVIKNNGDTIFGKIDYRGDLLMSSICKFKKENIITEYNPKDIIAFRFIDSKYYISKEINGKIVFIEYLIKGKINVFYLRDEKGDHYFLNKEDSVLVELPYNEEIRKRDGKEYLYKSTKHIGLLNIYMQDAPGLESEIIKIKKPEHQNMIKLAEDYHNVICNGDKCIIYEKKQPLIKVNYEVVAGMIIVTNTAFLDYGKLPFQTGLLFHFWLPRLNEKFYLKTGIMYSYLPGSNSPNIYPTNIPIHIGYLAPKTYRLRPTASISLFSPYYSGGLLVRINKRINLGAQSWFYFESHEGKFPWIPAKLSYYNILGSLYIEL